MKTYIAIDLKSFYASAECVMRNLDPLKTNLVVADVSRTEKTICLAVSPSLKAYGIPGRARLFEIIAKVKEINQNRLKNASGHKFYGKSFDADILKDPNLELDYIAATPQMAKYIEISSKIYGIYLKYVAAEDIHVYSIDEVFIDVTSYLVGYKMTAEELCRAMIIDVYNQTGITATGGVGSNLYLAKVAMDIVAKHKDADIYGVRIASLNEESYKKELWAHEPLTDFWRVGHGIARKLNNIGIYTMGDIARCSIDNEDILYRLFGINAELLIDHAWGIEPTTMEMIKAYKPSSHSISQGQVLHCGYDFTKSKLVAKEMADLLALDLVSKKLKAGCVGLYIGYDSANLDYDGEMSTDWYGRSVPKHAKGSVRFKIPTSSSRVMMSGIGKLFDEIVEKNLLIRRINIAAFELVDENYKPKVKYEQLNLFTDYEEQDRLEEIEAHNQERDKKAADAILKIKEKYGKNAVIRGMNLEEGSTMLDRNEQIGGHKA